MRLKLIACEVLYRELCAVVARSVNQVDLEFLPKGLHDLGSGRMRARIQEAVDGAAGGPYEAVLLGYALCGNGLAGLEARSVPLIVPRAHDCITLFLGSRKRYREYFDSHAGVYFQTSGWIERGQGSGTQLSWAFDDLVERYGEEDARYIYQELTKHYRQFAFIEMGVEPDGRFLAVLPGSHIVVQRRDSWRGDSVFFVGACRWQAQDRKQPEFSVGAWQRQALSEVAA